MTITCADIGKFYNATDINIVAHMLMTYGVSFSIVLDLFSVSGEE